VLAVYAVSVSPARRTALAVLSRVRRDDAFAGPVLSRELARASLTPQDAGLATMLAYGTLAAQGVLDEAIDRHIARAVEPRIRDVLRLAAYELFFGRAPAYAVVDQAVDLARGVRPQAAGLANAVVRKLAGEAESFPWGDPASDLDALARLTGHPRWIVDTAMASLSPAAAREMLDCGLEPAPVFARLDPFAGDTADTLIALTSAEPRQSPPDPDCYLLNSPAAAFRGGGTPGAWFPMDAAAQMAPLAVAPRSGEVVLDVGAGRGNKTLCLQAIAVRNGGPAAVTALDVHAGKTAALAERLARSGVPAVTTTVCDATDMASCFGAEAFDAVLVDAPCSGLGTLRRYPEKRWRLEPSAPSDLHELQGALLASSAAVVRPGGRVVYSTCSVARHENDDVVDEFLASAAGVGFRMESLEEVIPAEWERFCDARGCFRSWPTSGGPDGHYVAVLRRDSK